MSKTDQRNDAIGSRNWYWGKDTGAEPRCDAVPEDAMMVMIDVDYYVDMPSYLVNTNKPVAIYTFTPTSAAKTEGEVAYRFNEDQSIEYLVSGSGAYHHQLWDYAHDTIRAETYGWDPYITGPLFKFLGYPTASAHFAVDHHRVDADHAIILLTPLISVKGLLAPLLRYMRAAPLNRMCPVENGWTVLLIQSTRGLVSSVARLGSWAAASATSSNVDALKEIHELSTKGLSPPHVGSVIKDSTRAQQYVLASYVHSKSEGGTRVIEADVTKPRSYTYVTKDGDGTFDVPLDDTPGLTPFMNPIGPPGLVPSVNKQNETKCIQARLLDIRSDKTLDSRGLAYVKEFIKLLDLDGQLDPVPYDDVETNQDRPTQQAILESGKFEPLTEDDALQCRAFMKRESYAPNKAGDPRNITTVSGQFKIKFSMILYAVSKVLKEQKWYAFSKNPLEIATRVADILSDASSATETDHSRMDGRTAPAIRDAELLLYLAMFKEKWHEEIIELCNKQAHAQVTGAFGTRYLALWSRLSGSPDTSAGNTFINAVIQYIAYRRSGMTCGEAFAALGIYGGDDGLSANQDPENVRWAAALFGQVVTFDVKPRHSDGITFLSRYYSPAVWSGGLDSCADIGRQLAKFHLSGTLPPTVTPLHKLVEKARAFALTDPNTPILGEFATLVMRLHNESKEKQEDLSEYDARALAQTASYWSKYDESVQYPNNNCGRWMERYVLDLGMDVSAFRGYLQTAQTLDDLLHVPSVYLHVDLPVVASPAVVDGVLIVPPVQVIPDAVGLPSPNPSASPNPGTKPGDDPSPSRDSKGKGGKGKGKGKGKGRTRGKGGKPKPNTSPNAKKK